MHVHTLDSLHCQRLNVCVSIITNATGHGNSHLQLRFINLAYILFEVVPGRETYNAFRRTFVTEFSFNVLWLIEKLTTEQNYY